MNRLFGLNCGFGSAARKLQNAAAVRTSPKAHQEPPDYQPVPVTPAAI
jgi:hypothetical protein